MEKPGTPGRKPPAQFPCPSNDCDRVGAMRNPPRFFCFARGTGPEYLLALGGPGRGVSGDGGVRGLQDRDGRGTKNRWCTFNFKRTPACLPLRVDIEIEKKTYTFVYTGPEIVLPPTRTMSLSNLAFSSAIKSRRVRRFVSLASSVIILQKRSILRRATVASSAILSCPSPRRIFLIELFWESSQLGHCT